MKTATKELKKLRSMAETSLHNTAELKQVLAQIEATLSRAESQKVIDNEHDGKTLTLSKAKLGVRTIMVVSGVIFSLFVVSYSDRMLVHDWKSLSEPWLLWVNTIILIFTSLIFHKSKVLSEKNEFEKAKNYLFLVARCHIYHLLGPNVSFRS